MDKTRKHNNNQGRREREPLFSTAPIADGSPIRERPRGAGGFMLPLGYLTGGAIGPCAGSMRASVPVRRHSHTAGRCEGVFWRRTDRKSVSRIVLAAERYDRETKEKGRRNGALGHVALEVLRLLANLVDYRTGQLDPAYETIAAKIGRARSAVIEAVKRLRLHGFIDWLRRYVSTDSDRGPQVKQTSNAYRLCLPERAKRALGRYGQDAPVPDDAAHHQAEKAAEWGRMLEQITCEEKAHVLVEDEGLAAALGRLGAAIDAKAAHEKERESAERSESPSTSILYGGTA